MKADAASRAATAERCRERLRLAALPVKRGSLNVWPSPAWQVTGLCKGVRVSSVLLQGNPEGGFVCQRWHKGLLRSSSTIIMALLPTIQGVGHFEVPRLWPPNRDARPLRPSGALLAGPVNIVQLVPDNGESNSHSEPENTHSSYWLILLGDQVQGEKRTREELQRELLKKKWWSCERETPRWSNRRPSPNG